MCIVMHFELHNRSWVRERAEKRRGGATHITLKLMNIKNEDSM
jgi:hypothetical protein